MAKYIDRIRVERACRADGCGAKFMAWAYVYPGGKRPISGSSYCSHHQNELATKPSQARVRADVTWVCDGCGVAFHPRNKQIHRIRVSRYPCKLRFHSPECAKENVVRVRRDRAGRRRDCSVAGCGRNANVRGSLCESHRRRQLRGAEWDVPLRVRSKPRADGVKGRRRFLMERREAIASGLCGVCRKNPLLTDRAYCAECADRIKKRRNVMYRRKRGLPDDAVLKRGPKPRVKEAVDWDKEDPRWILWEAGVA